MKSELLKTIELINQWRDDRIREINNHANNQIAILQTDYDEQRDVFDDKREEKLKQFDKITRYHETVEKFYHECRALKFELATLRQQTESITFCYVFPAGKRQSEISSGQTRDSVDTQINGVGNNSVVQQKPGLENFNAEQLNLSGSASRLGSSKHKVPLPPIESSKDATKSTEDPKKAPIPQNNEDMSCPICFMIFPISLSGDDRQRHVNGHCVDDYGP